MLLPLVMIREKRIVGGSNVDDYIYSFFTMQAGRPDQPRVWIETLLNSGQISPLVPALTSVTRTDTTPYMSSVAQIVFMTLLFVSCRGIARQLGEAHPTLWALTATAFPAMIGWAAMFHFAVASSALLAASVWMYLSSDGLVRWRRAALFGAACGALSLSRSVALVYLAALGAVVLWNLLRRLGSRSAWIGLGAALLAAAFTAGPWWVVSGPDVMKYLLGAGYDSTSGFARDVSLVEKVQSRLSHVGDEWGWTVLLVLLLLAGLWVADVALRRSTKTPDGGDGESRNRWMVIAIVVLGIAALASSSNAGTAFSLPFAPLLILALVSGSRRLRARWPAAARVGLVLALTVATVGSSMLASQPRPADALNLTTSWHSLLHGAGWQEGDVGPEEVTRSVAASLQGHDVVVARDDALLNANGLLFQSRYGGTPLGAIRLAPFGVSDWTPSASELDGAVVLTGQSPANYHRLDRETVMAHLQTLQYEPACEFDIGPGNAAVLMAPQDTALECGPLGFLPGAPE